MGMRDRAAAGAAAADDGDGTGSSGVGATRSMSSRGGCGLARVPIDPNKFEAKQSTGLASPALVPADQGQESHLGTG